MYLSSAFCVSLLLLLQLSSARISSPTSTRVRDLDSQSKLSHPEAQDPRDLSKKTRVRKHKKNKKHKKHKKKQHKKKKSGLPSNGDENTELNTTLFEEDIIPTSEQVVEEYGAELLEELEQYDVLIEDGNEENSTRTRELALTDKTATRLWKDRVDGVVTVAYKFDSGSFGSKSHFSESEKQTSKSTLPELLLFFHCIIFSLSITP